MRMCKISVLWFCLVLLSSIAYAEDESNAKPNADKDEGRGFSEIDWGFGIGIGFIDDFSSTPRVKRASVVDSIVRVDERSNDGARLMLESHWFFDETFTLFGSTVHHGPFVSISGGDENFLDTFGAGYMLGFSKPDGTTSWNIGIGAVNDREVQVLGDGLEPDMPLPGAETEIRFKTTDKWGAMLMFSLGFGLDRDSNRTQGLQLTNTEQEKLDRDIELLRKKAELDARTREFESLKKKSEEDKPEKK